MNSNKTNNAAKPGKGTISMVLMFACLLPLSLQADQKLKQASDEITAKAEKPDERPEGQGLPKLHTQLHGNLQQGGMVWGQFFDKCQLMVNRFPVDVAEDGFFVFGLDRDAPSEVLFEASCWRSQPEIRKLKIKTFDYDIERIEGVAGKYMSPSIEQSRRAVAEAERIREARGLYFARRDFREQFIWPSKGRISGEFGSQRIYNGVPKRPHYGVDIAAPMGTEVIAPASGVVTYVEDMFYSGLTMVIDHGHGISSTFLHLSEVAVQPWQEVKQGQVVAKVGAGGRVTGPHLDWRINWYAETRMNPQLLVSGKPEPIGAE